MFADRRPGRGAVLGRALLAALVAAVLLTAAAGADTWADPAGDAGGGPDLTGASATNDQSGTVVFDVRVANLRPDGVVRVILDSDTNGKTDDPIDRTVELTRLASGKVAAAVFAHDASGKPVPASAPSLVSSAGPLFVAFLAASADLGVNRGFSFRVETASDRAPDTGSFVYIVAPPQPVAMRPIIGTPTTVPKKPAAGKRFTATFPVLRSDSGGPVTTGKLTCVLRIAGIAPKFQQSFRNGKARVSLVLPRTAKRKTLRIALTIRAEDRSARKVVTFRIR